jgi:hypothetical protein
MHVVQHVVRHVVQHVVQHVWLCANYNIKCMNVKINALYTDSVRTSQTTHCTNNVQRNVSVHCRSRTQRVTSPGLDVIMWLLDVASLGLGVMPPGLDTMPCRRIKTCLVPLFSASSSTRNWALKVEAILSLETSVNTYQSARLHVPEEPNLQQHRCENLKFRTVNYGCVHQREK